MPPKKKPVAVLEADGSRHYTKDELEARRSREIQAPDGETVKAPPYITGKLLKEFKKLAPVLQAMGVLSSVDGDVLGQYLVARNQYVTATKQISACMNHDPVDLTTAEKWSKLQDTYFKQCMRCAQELGLTVTARANILLPQTVESVSEEEADMFGD